METLAVVAHHEAGHAVAAAMRGHEPYRIDLNADGSGECRHMTFHRFDDAFIAYAGMWAEARYAWGQGHLPTDREDDDGLTFSDHLVGVVLEQRADAEVYLAFLRDWPPEQQAATEQVWEMELERAWLFIREQASLALEGQWKPITRDDIPY